MRHEAGLIQLWVDKAAIQRENIKKNSIGAVIEKMTPFWHKHTERSYHAMNRGWIIGEIVRRVDPKKRTLGEFVKEEISEPLGIDFYIGLPDSKL